MKTLLFNRWFLFSIRLVLSAVFVYAGVIKVIDPQSFADSVASFKILPSPLIGPTALSLPPMEIVVGVLLLIGRYKRQAAASIFALGTVFAIALVQAIFRGLEVDCGCFGEGDPSIWSTWMSLGRDLLILLGSGLLYKSSGSPPSKLRESELYRLSQETSQMS